MICATQALLLDELVVRAFRSDELQVRALLDHTASVNDVDLVRVLHCRKTMRDLPAVISMSETLQLEGAHGNGGPTSRRLVECLLHDLFRLAIKGRGRLVEQQYTRVPNQRACDAAAC